MLTKGFPEALANFTDISQPLQEFLANSRTRFNELYVQCLKILI